MADTRFKNSWAVFSWLARPEAEGGGGYRIGKSKLYADIKEKLLLPGDDGWFSLEDVKAYAKAANLPKAGPSSRERQESAELEGLRLRKERAAVQDAEDSARITRMKADKQAGLLMPRDEFEAELAARALVLDAGLRRLVRERCADWVFQSGGRQDKVRDVIDTIEEELDRLMNEYASMEVFQVMLAPGEAEDAGERSEAVQEEDE